MTSDHSDVQLVTLRIYPFLHEALIAREMLEAEGVFALVPDEHTISMDWLYRNAIGGIRLQVPSDDVPRATEILGPELVANNNTDVDGDSLEQCAECGGTDFEPIATGRRVAAATWLLMSFPLWWPRRRMRCKACGAIAPT